MRTIATCALALTVAASSKAAPFRPVGTTHLSRNHQPGDGGPQVVFDNGAWTRTEWA
jgi:hypothetical protein